MQGPAKAGTRVLAVQGKQGKQPARGFAAGSCLPPCPEGPSLVSHHSSEEMLMGWATSGDVSSLPLTPSTFPKRKTRGAACHNGCTSPWQTLSALTSPVLTTLGSSEASQSLRHLNLSFYSVTATAKQGMVEGKKEGEKKHFMEEGEISRRLQLNRAALVTST